MNIKPLYKVIWVKKAEKWCTSWNDKWFFNVLDVLNHGREISEQWQGELREFYEDTGIMDGCDYWTDGT